jgi:phosphotransferase family enzyme
MTGLITSYSSVEWSADGALVTKTRTPAFDARRRFRNELRVNRMLRGNRPPVPTPVLVDHDVQRRRLTFAAVAGEPLGPKYPVELSGACIDGMVDLGRRLRAYNPNRRWLRVYDSARRITLARRAGLLTDSEADQLLGLARSVHAALRFGHGDLTARNVMAGPDGLTLIDWEWAGLYPDGYELAFLWFSLVDVDGGRARVEQRVDGDDRAFLLSALLIQLWHLHWYVPAEFRAKHLATRDGLIARLSL